MVDLRPLRALRPLPEHAAAVSAPPYDVVDVAEARAIAGGNPLSFLHVSRPEIDLPPDLDPHDGAVHAQGRDALCALVASGVLRQDETASFYVYRQRMGPRTQTGVVGCAAVADYTSGAIATHEHTRPDKEDDRVRHLSALRAHDEPVFLMCPRVTAVDDAVREVCRTSPEYDFASDDGVRHTLWAVPDPRRVEQVRMAFAAVPRVYVADGHHRSAAAARVHTQGAAGSDAFPVVVFPADELTVLPYNRVVADLDGLTADGLVAALDGAFDVRTADDAVEPFQRQQFGVYAGGRWWDVRARAVPPGDVIAALDVSVLQSRVLGALLGVGDPRTDTRLAFVGGIRGTAELERLVDSGRFAVAFSLHPTSTSDVMAVADLGMVMPPKSTWFEPKLRSGLFVHLMGEPG